MKLSLLAFAAFCLLSFQLTADSDLTPAQQRGKRIYTEGTSDDAQGITARMSGAAMPASVLPCGSCHGTDGRGRPEGGVTPSDLTWAALTRPYATQLQSGRKRSPYTEASLARAISEGVDPDGEELHVAMPRFEMSEADMSDLIAYLKMIDQDDDPGISDDLIRIGVNSDAISQYRVMAAYLDLVNQAGGLYGRKISLIQYAQFSFNTSVRPISMAKNIFSFVGGDPLVISTKETSKTKFLAEIPSVGTINPYFYTLSRPTYNQDFSLFADLKTQILRLWDYTTTQLSASPANTVILYKRGRVQDLLLESLQAYAKENEKQPFEVQEVIEWDDTIRTKFAEWAKDDKKIVIDLSINKEELVEFAAANNWYPHIISVALLMPSYSEWEAPKAFSQKIHIATPTWEGARDTAAMANYRALAARYDLPQNPSENDLHSLSAIILFTETLKTIGRDLTREKLIQSLESLRNFKTGFVPPLTYSLNRREGSRKVYIMTGEKGESGISWKLSQVME